ncbi:MAG TPA: hypothetical protein PLY93_05150, partial [Turneriella sp.]|nr:hypothetical protein [Turneriella sp.]
MRPDEIDATASTKFEDSPVYRKIYDQLNTIRDAYPEMIRYAYTFIKANAEGKALYVVDANVLSSRQRAA